MDDGDYREKTKYNYTDLIFRRNYIFVNGNNNNHDNKNEVLMKFCLYLQVLADICRTDEIMIVKE